MNTADHRNGHSIWGQFDSRRIQFGGYTAALAEVEQQLVKNNGWRQNIFTTSSVNLRSFWPNQRRLWKQNQSSSGSVSVVVFNFLTFCDANWMYGAYQTILIHFFFLMFALKSWSYLKKIVESFLTQSVQNIPLFLPNLHFHDFVVLNIKCTAEAQAFGLVVCCI